MRAPVLLEIDKENVSEGRGSVIDTVSKARAMCKYFTVAIRSLRANFEPGQGQLQC